MRRVAPGPVRVAAVAGLAAGLAVGLAHTAIEQPGTDDVAQALVRQIEATSGHRVEDDEDQPHDRVGEAAWFGVQAGVGVAGLVYVVASAGSRRGVGSETAR